MSIGFFLSLFIREVNGEGAECPFSGSGASGVAKSQDSSADMIAHQTIHICLSPIMNRPESKGRAFNVGDEIKTHCWRDKWPVLCSQFGLCGVKRPGDNPIEVRKYIKDNLSTWEAMERKYSLQTGQADNEKTFPGFEYFLLTQFDMDRQYDITSLYDGAGFKEREMPVCRGVVCSIG